MKTYADGVGRKPQVFLEITDDGSSRSASIPLTPSNSALMMWALECRGTIRAGSFAE